MESTDENSVQLVIDAIKQAIIDGKVQKVEDVTSDSEAHDKVYDRFGYILCYVQRVEVTPRLYQFPHRKVIR